MLKVGQGLRGFFTSRTSKLMTPWGVGNHKTTCKEYKIGLRTKAAYCMDICFDRSKNYRDFAQEGENEKVPLKRRAYLLSRNNSSAAVNGVREAVAG
jgi:hypothetical protein